MKLDKFEKNCHSVGMKLVARADIDGLVVLVADGFTMGNNEVQHPHYRTMYAVGQTSNDLKFAQSIYHDLNEGLGKKGFEKQRIDDAMNQALSAITALKEETGGGIIRA